MQAYAFKFAETAGTATYMLHLDEAPGMALLVIPHEGAEVWFETVIGRRHRGLTAVVARALNQRTKTGEWPPVIQIATC